MQEAADCLLPQSPNDAPGGSRIKGAEATRGVKVSLFAPLKQKMPCANRTAGDVPVRQKKNKWMCCCRCFCLTFAAPLGPGGGPAVRSHCKFEQKCFTVPHRSLFSHFMDHRATLHAVRGGLQSSPRSEAERIHHRRG